MLDPSVKQVSGPPAAAGQSLGTFLLKVEDGLLCTQRHTPAYVVGLCSQGDDVVTLYNESLAKPGKEIMTALERRPLRTDGLPS